MSSSAKQEQAIAASSADSAAIAPAQPTTSDDSDGPWSDVTLVSTLASLAVIDENGAMETFDGDWSLCVEIMDMFFSEWLERHSSLEASIRDHCPWIFLDHAVALYENGVELHLPALVHITSVMRALGRRMRDMVADPQRDWRPSVPEPSFVYPAHLSVVMNKLKAWQERLMSLLTHEMERLRSVMPPIRVRALLQRSEMDMEEALASAVDSRLEAHSSPLSPRMDRHSFLSADADVALLSQPIRNAVECCGPDRSCWRCNLNSLSSVAPAPPLSPSPSSASSPPSSSASLASPASSSPTPTSNPCRCRRCRRSKEPALVGPLLHPAVGEWSASDLAARIAALPVIHPTKTIEQCHDWPFFIELASDSLADWSARQLPLLRGVIDQGPAAATSYREEMQYFYERVRSLHLPAMTAITDIQRKLGRRICELNAQAQQTTHFVHRTRKQHEACMRKLRLHQEYLLQLMMREMDRLRLEAQSIALALQIEEMDAEAAEWAHVHWQAQFLGA